jgi:hypothetical protein
MTKSNEVALENAAASQVLAGAPERGVRKAIRMARTAPHAFTAPRAVFGRGAVVLGRSLGVPR